MESIIFLKIKRNYGQTNVLNININGTINETIFEAMGNI